MAKLTLTDISSGYSSKEAINDNNTAIEEAVENTLSRDGTSPNQMEANFDMNGYRILNLPDAVDNSEPITLSQVTALGTSLTTEETAANIADASSAINTSGKVSGKIVWDTTNKRLLRASGSSSVADWEVVDGSAQVTPS